MEAKGLKKSVPLSPLPECPLRLINKCNSSVITEDHFDAEHVAIEINGYKWSYPIDLRKRIWPEGFYARVANKKYVYLQSVSKTDINIHIIDVEPGALNENAVITFTDGVVEMNNHVTILKRKHTIKYNNYALLVNIDTLRKYFGLRKINVNVNFPKLEPKTTILKISETMREKLKCPECKNTMRPPIFQCVVGHSICHKCKPALTECPECKQGLSDSRAFTLEDMCREFTYPCINKEYGCNIDLVLDQIDGHELICDSKPFVCPICSWRNTYNNLKLHLTETHRIRIYNNIKMVTELKNVFKNENTKSYVFLEIMNRLHFIEITMGPTDYEFTTMIVGNSEPVKQEPHFYQIILMNSQNRQRNVCRTEQSDNLIILSKKSVDCIDKFDSILLACKIL